MFTRIVETHVKTGKTRELSNLVNDKVLPILKRQTGFVDEITLIATTEPDTAVSLSFWDNEDNAKRYHDKEFSTITQMIGHLLETPPKVRTFEVELSTIHKIAKGKAA